MGRMILDSREVVRTIREAMKLRRAYLERCPNVASKGRHSRDADEATAHLYVVLHDKLSHQLDAVDSIDAKVATIFTFANAVVPVLSAVLVAERNIRRIVPVSIVAGLAGAPYLASLVVLFIAYRVGQWDLGPDRKELFQHVVEEEHSAYQIRVWMAGELITALNSNDRKLTKKARSLDQALVFLVLQVILGTTASLISIF